SMRRLTEYQKVSGSSFPWPPASRPAALRTATRLPAPLGALACRSCLMTLFALVARFRMRAVKLCERGVKDPLGRLELPVGGAEIAIEMSYRLGQRAAPAPYALPAGFAMFLAVGTAAAALHGRLPATGVLIACAGVAFAVSFAAEPIASVLLAGIGWLTVIGFSRPPYAQLRPAGPAAVHGAVVV